MLNDINMPGAVSLPHSCAPTPQGEMSKTLSVWRMSFFFMNEYLNLFGSANYSQMNVQIYLVIIFLMNEYSNIFVHLGYSRMNV